MAEYCRILIIDDEYIMRQGLKHMIDWEKEGFQIVGEASNGKEGLEMIPKVHPHIILCDIVMPEMDGVEFAGILKDKYPEIRMIVLSGYDNFEYVRSTLMYGAADYVLKPMLKPDELLAALVKTARQIPGVQLVKQSTVTIEMQMEQYMTGKLEELPGNTAKEKFRGTFFRVYAANIRKHEGKQNMASILYNKAEEYLESMKECTHVLLFLNEELLCVVFNYDARRREWLESEIQKLTEMMTLLFGRFYAVLGEEFRNLSKMRENFVSTLLSVSDQAFYYRDVHLQVMDGSVQKNIEKKKFDFAQYSGLTGNGRTQEALVYLMDYVREAAEDELDEYRLKNITKNMLYSLFTSLEDREEEMDRLRLQTFRKIDGAPYLQEFMQILENLEEELNRILGFGESREDRTIREILEYISANYEENLDLQEVAEVFHFNYYYLSAYFNTKVSEGFSGYLNRIRVEHACGLLKSSNIPISEVSGKVGYSDHSYFCRAFKKITGKTPSAYRRENEKGVREHTEKKQK